MVEVNDISKYITQSNLFAYKVSKNLLSLTGDTGATMKSNMGVNMLFGIPPEVYWPNTDIKGADPNGFDRGAQHFLMLLQRIIKCISNAKIM